MSASCLLIFETKQKNDLLPPHPLPLKLPLLTLNFISTSMNPSPVGDWLEQSLWP